MMKRFILASLAVVLLLAGIGYLVYYRGIYVDFKPEVSVTAHFRTQGKEIQYLDGDTWKTMEIRGVDLSSNIPGEAMLDFVPAYEDYSRWLEQIGEMGANTIRVHTVMDDDFYEAFYDYNTTKEKPLYLLQGLSVPDRANYGTEDIYQEEFVDLLLENATKAVDVIHGNRAIELGNFTGTGWYQWDVSPWTLGYLLGHEWDSGIIAYTNHSTLGETSYQGTYFYTKPEASRFETAMAKLMDRVTAYESDKYKEQRLISFVNSPWDDPFVYDTLYNARFDTYNQVDMEHIGASAELLSGYFVSYRLETLCPDYQKYFTREQKAKLGELLTGLETGDLYSGYLTLLNRYYTVPIMATGFGFSTARMPVVENHSPLNEQQQGEALVELWQKMRGAGWTGGFVSTWQDVWDRNTWNTVYANYSFGVDNWQDVQTDGQNYGLMEFWLGSGERVCTVDGNAAEWQDKEPVWSSDAMDVYMDYDERYLYFYVDGFSPETDVLYLPIDTTPKTGSTYWEEKKISFERGCDFVVTIDGKDNSRVLVQERYESLWVMYAYETDYKNPYAKEYWREKDSPVFRPIRSIMEREGVNAGNRWVAMPTYETGKLRYGNADPDSPAFDSLADFCFAADGVEIRIPWGLLNFSNPAERMIHDDYYEHYGVEYIQIDEMFVGAAVASDIKGRIPMASFPLEGWGEYEEYQERLKKSYDVLQAAWSGR